MGGQESKYTNTNNFDRVENVLERHIHDYDPETIFTLCILNDELKSQCNNVKWWDRYLNEKYGWSISNYVRQYLPESEEWDAKITYMMMFGMPGMRTINNYLLYNDAQESGQWLRSALLMKELRSWEYTLGNRHPQRYGSADADDSRERIEQFKQKIKDGVDDPARYYVHFYYGIYPMIWTREDFTEINNLIQTYLPDTLSEHFISKLINRNIQERVRGGL